MAMKSSSRGFALYVAIIFMAVMLSFGITLSSLGYKQVSLAASALASQAAFYAADAGLECALYADQVLGTFVFPSPDPGDAPDFTCDGAFAVTKSETSYDAGGKNWIVEEHFNLDNGTRCAYVQVQKYDPSVGNNPGTALYAQGYSVPCATVEANTSTFASRGIFTSY